MIKNGIKYGLMTACFFVRMNTLSAADNDSVPEIRNNILFFKDPRVDVLQKMYIRKGNNNKKAIRVQIFQAASRDKIFEAKAQFSARFPGIVTFVTYAPPNFPASFVIEEKGKEEEDKAKPK
jgi:hypothetical protein